MNRDAGTVQVRDAWVKLIEDLGLQYNFVSYAQIEGGLLNSPSSDAERYKVLVLPESIALSPKEADEIRAFVERGGSVIGDLHVGLMDDKCRRQPDGLLDDVFGIERTGGDEALPVGISLAGVDTPIRLPAGESSVRARGATARAQVPGTDVPALLWNSFGKGHAAYLNLDLSSFENERRFATLSEKALREALLAVLGDCGTRPVYPVAQESGTPAHIEVVRYASGPLEYLCLLRSAADDRPDTARVPLGRPRHAYDVRAGRHLGRVEALTVPMQPGDCRLYCLAPAPLGKVACEASGTVAAGGTVRYRLTLSPGSEGETQLVRVRFLRPDGTEATDYARNHLVGRSAVQATAELALNDPPGRWRIVARGLCTGEVAEAALQVQ
jgi:hypothetical protein